jgi:hypothetical protein
MTWIPCGREHVDVDASDIWENWREKVSILILHSSLEEPFGTFLWFKLPDRLDNSDIASGSGGLG